MRYSRYTSIPPTRNNRRGRKYRMIHGNRQNDALRYRKEQRAQPTQTSKHPRIAGAQRKGGRGVVVVSERRNLLPRGRHMCTFDAFACKAGHLSAEISRPVALYVGAVCTWSADSRASSSPFRVCLGSAVYADAPCSSPVASIQLSHICDCDSYRRSKRSRMAESRDGPNSFSDLAEVAP